MHATPLLTSFSFPLLFQYKPRWIWSTRTLLWSGLWLLCLLPIGHVSQDHFTFTHQPSLISLGASRLFFSPLRPLSICSLNLDTQSLTFHMIPLFLQSQIKGLLLTEDFPAHPLKIRHHIVFLQTTYSLSSELFNLYSHVCVNLFILSSTLEYERRTMCCVVIGVHHYVSSIQYTTWQTAGGQ